LALEFVWTNLTNGNQSTGEAQGFIGILEQIIIEKEECSSPWAPFDSEALYVAYSIIYSLQAYLMVTLKTRSERRVRITTFWATISMKPTARLQICGMGMFAR